MLLLKKVKRPIGILERKESLKPNVIVTRNGTKDDEINNEKVNKNSVQTIDETFKTNSKQPSIASFKESSLSILPVPFYTDSRIHFKN